MEFVNKKGLRWYLHCRDVVIGRNKQKVKTYFFRRERKDDVCSELPATLTISETISGLPLVKKLSIT